MDRSLTVGLAGAEARKLGMILHERAQLSTLQIDTVLQEQQRRGGRFGEVAIGLGLVTPQEVEEALARQFGYPIVDAGETRVSPAVTAAFKPASSFAEALRALRSQLMQRWFDGSPARTALAIASVDRGDGKSFILSNLAVVFSQLGERTLLVDADLRHPVQHKTFGLPNRMGLSGILSGRADLREIASVAPFDNLSVLASGPLPPNPQELLGRRAFVQLLNHLSGRYDAILIDTPSAQESSDAQVVARRAGAALLVGRKGRTRTAELTRLSEVMSSAGVAILGATLNEC